MSAVSLVIRASEPPPGLIGLIEIILQHLIKKVGHDERSCYRYSYLLSDPYLICLKIYTYKKNAYFSMFVSWVWEVEFIDSSIKSIGPNAISVK